MRVLGFVAWGVATALAAGLLVPEKAAAGSLDGFVGGLAGGMIGAAIAGSMAQQRGQPRYYGRVERRRAPVRSQAARSNRQPVSAASTRGSTIKASADPFAKPQQPATVPVSIQQ